MKAIAQLCILYGCLTPILWKTLNRYLLYFSATFSVYSTSKYLSTPSETFNKRGKLQNARSFGSQNRRPMSVMLYQLPPKQSWIFHRLLTLQNWPKCSSRNQCNFIAPPLFSDQGNDSEDSTTKKHTGKFSKEKMLKWRPVRRREGSHIGAMSMLRHKGWKLNKPFVPSKDDAAGPNDRQVYDWGGWDIPWRKNFVGRLLHAVGCLISNTTADIS